MRKLKLSSIEVKSFQTVDPKYTRTGTGFTAHGPTCYHTCAGTACEIPSYAGPEAYPCDDQSFEETCPIYCLKFHPQVRKTEALSSSLGKGVIRALESPAPSVRVGEYTATAALLLPDRIFLTLHPSGHP